MRKIIKANAPASFTTYVNKRNPLDQTYRPTFQGMDAKVKKDLQQSLLDEQGWICGYCQQKILSEDRMKIEHYCEQSICNGENGTNDRRLDYTNLMAVCLGNGGKLGLHCDSNKATDGIRNMLPINVSPWLQAHINTIIYKSSGIMESSNTLYDSEIKKVLNLNIEILKDLRSKKFASIFKASRHTNAAQQKLKMKRILEDDLEFGNKRFSNSFPGMSEYMLKKYCTS